MSRVTDDELDGALYKVEVALTQATKVDDDNPRPSPVVLNKLRNDGLYALGTYVVLRDRQQTELASLRVENVRLERENAVLASRERTSWSTRLTWLALGAALTLTIARLLNA